jgi:hypothetical protein
MQALKQFDPVWQLGVPGEGFARLEQIDQTIQIELDGIYGGLLRMLGKY